MSASLADRKAASTPPDLVEIRDLVVTFGDQPAVRGLDLTLRRGEALGIVGESGCGKSVTWLAALGLLPPTATVEGSVRLAGQELLGAAPATLDTLRGGRIAIIFQDPTSSLNPVHRVGTQVREALRLHRGMDHRAAAAEALRLFDLVGIPDSRRRVDLYPHELSGGQNQRVMIAMALAGQPDVLIADEPTTALDATIQAQILELLQKVQRETGMALVLISHDLGVVAELCQRVGVMYAGRMVEMAEASQLFAHPLHPYTKGLLAALPDLSGPRRRLVPIQGSVPEPGAMPAGCAFMPRCPDQQRQCTALPALRELAPAHHVACVRAPIMRAAP